MQLLAQQPWNPGAPLPFWRQLRWQLTFALALLAVVAVLVVETVTLSETSSQARRQVFDRLNIEVDLKQAQLELWLDQATSTLALILSGPNADQIVALLQAPGSSSSQQRVNDLLLATLSARNTDQIGAMRYRTLFIYTADGDVVAASDPAQLGKQVRRQPFFTSSLAGVHIQPPFYTSDSDELNIVVSQRVLDQNGKLVGVLAGYLDLTYLRGLMFDRKRLGVSGETYLVSSESNYLLTPSRYPDYPLTRAYHSEGIDRALRQESGNGEYLDYRSPPVMVLGAYRWVPALQAGLIAELDLTEALEANRRSRDISIAVGVLASLIAGLLGLFLATRISSPIRDMTRSATRISLGDLDQRVVVRQSDEIGVLAHGFNLMTDQLRQTLGTLEQRIAERTADLEQALSEREQTLSALRESIEARDLLSATVRELSSPVLPLTRDVLVMPLIGTIDTGRAALLVEALLQSIERQRARIVIIDVTGVPIVDTQVAHTLLQAASSVRLLGAEPVLVGLRPELAQTIVGLGIDLSDLTIQINLESGVRYALSRRHGGLARR
jgi:rsbT co-antagonist protein RsbR